LKRRKIAVFLAGQTGNQLFQLAAAEYQNLLSDQQDFEIEVLVSDATPVTFLSIKYPKVSISQLEHKLLSFLLSRNLNQQRSALLAFSVQIVRLVLKMLFVYRLKSFVSITVSDAVGSPPPLLPENRKGVTVLIGYFQEYYFADVADEIRMRMRSLIPALSFQESTDNAEEITLHVRRTDYSESLDLGMLDSSFYIGCLNNCFPESDWKTKNIRIVTDDPLLSWNFLGSNSDCLNILSPIQQTALEAFHSLLNARQIVIANSSFGWWAAYLNSGEERRVLAPSPWFRTIEALTQNPSTWLRCPAVWSN
jgi:hypothetical protein